MSDATNPFDDVVAFYDGYDEARDTLLRFLRTVETEPLLMGASPHLLACARR